MKIEPHDVYIVRKKGEKQAVMFDTKYDLKEFIEEQIDNHYCLDGAEFTIELTQISEEEFNDSEDVDAPW